MPSNTHICDQSHVWNVRSVFETRTPRESYSSVVGKRQIVNIGTQVTREKTTITAWAQDQREDVKVRAGNGIRVCLFRRRRETVQGGRRQNGSLFRIVIETTAQRAHRDEYQIYSETYAGKGGGLKQWKKDKRMARKQDTDGMGTAEVEGVREVGEERGEKRREEREKKFGREVEARGRNPPCWSVPDPPPPGADASNLWKGVEALISALCLKPKETNFPQSILPANRRRFAPLLDRLVTYPGKTLAHTHPPCTLTHARLNPHGCAAGHRFPWSAQKSLWPAAAGKRLKKRGPIQTSLPFLHPDTNSSVLLDWTWISTCCPPENAASSVLAVGQSLCTSILKRRIPEPAGSLSHVSISAHPAGFPRLSFAPIPAGPPAGSAPLTVSRHSGMTELEITWEFRDRLAPHSHTPAPNSKESSAREANSNHDSKAVQSVR
ncbi:hypothetical protein CISG_03359 [Coccidioides immitis RMSCC 3703]|uniref:Uncharacterized protein n=1 Tax=Coccidioides immitis RMSCC 3703 TaxID=454286 RepID=A0A0J8THE7_COCIT|nr:hypothetical protein CISG_03359 [Coccidioides immitis RMSCC 3703]